ncbi:hypothetical protein Rrhod_4416 [Rhodococcus rhodnii LMG 5362]|uniref:Uncharacterized protein n=1 Tax=Rhodococcus rhodnii LMG 5362 TaxID=1273125 RepID=R7WGX2_9NOCA|nr:hypothetical protein Rrhod_4416 [Rhodococcus rhodnii LMG 5362]
MIGVSSLADGRGGSPLRMYRTRERRRRQMNDPFRVVRGVSVA